MQTSLPIKARKVEGDWDDATNERFEVAKRWRRQARIAQADNRAEMATDEDFYDTIQLEPEDIAILLGRDQPPLTFNITKHVTNWILGLEQRAKIDYNILPRKQKHTANAKAKTNYMKYINDVSSGEFVRSEAFAEATIAGLGWLETGVRKTDEIFYYRSERWRNMWYDHLSVAHNYKDMRYLWREKWTDLDVAIAMFPDYEDSLKILCDSVNSLYPWRAEDAPVIDVASEFDLEDGLGYYGANGDVRERIKLIEMEYRIPSKVQLMKMQDEDTPYGTLNGAIYRKGQADHDYLIKGKYFTLTDAIKMTIRKMIWAGDILFQDNLSPYDHKQFSFIPIFCYRRKRDNMPYGVIRDFRDPQTDFNRRKSKMLFLLSANQSVLEENATNNPAKFHEELQRPDGMGIVKEGKLGAWKQIEHGQQIADHHKIAEDDERFIYSLGGVTADSTWQKKRELSGVAIDKLQIQSTQSHGVLFKNYWQAIQLAGEILLSNIEQFGDREKEVRVIGEKQNADFITVNQRNPDGSIENSITAHKSDFIVSKQDYRETIRKAAIDQLVELMQTISKVPKGAEISFILLDLLVDFMDDLPNKDEIVARIRSINKQFAPEDEMTDEEKAQAQQTKDQLKQETDMMKQLQLAMAQVKVMSEQNKGLKLASDAMEKKLNAFLKAMEAAGTVAGSPHLVEAADSLIKEAESAGSKGEGV